MLLFLLFLLLLTRYKAWHAWAVMNFETVLFYKLSPTGLTPAHISLYGVPALQGFVRSISLSSGSSLQDALRLLTLWFDYGHHNDMYEALNEGLRTIDINTWLQVTCLLKVSSIWENNIKN